MTAAISAGNSSCFTVSATGNPLLQLSVGPAGGPVGCLVDATGCTYNPTIREGYPQDSEGPGLEIVTPELFGATAEGPRFTIEWWASDASDEARVELYYDLDNDGEDGTLIAEGIAAAEGAHTWKTRRVTPGAYYLYAVLHDAGVEPVSAVSDGQVSVGLKMGR